jgi:hypothetical protein
VVARDGDGVGAGLGGRGGSLAAAGLADLGVLNTVLAFGVQDTVSKLVQSLAERVVVAILIVVTHLGCLGGGSVTGSVNGLFGDLDVLVEGRARSRSVDGRLGYADGLLVAGDVARSVDGGVVEVRGLLEGRAVAGGVDGGAGVGDFVTVVGLETGTILALSNVDDGVLRAVVVIVLDARLGERGLGSATLFAKVLLLDAGTAVFTGDADLFLDASLLTGRDFGLDLKGVLTFFPSGVRGGFDL